MSTLAALATTDPANSVLAASLTTWLTSTANQFEAVVKAGATAVIFFFILKELIQSFTLTKLLVAGLVGGIAYWLIWSGGVQAIGNMMGDQAKSMPATVATVPHQAAPAPLVV